MINVENLSQYELAACVDEYVRRALNHIRIVESLDSIIATVTINAAQFSRSAEYEIKHRVQIGSSYDKNGEATYTGNNAILGAERCVAQMLGNLSTPPTVVRPMLTHTPEPDAEPETYVEEIEDAEVSEVVSNAPLSGDSEVDEDRPF